MFTNIPGLAHLALDFGGREEWLAQLRHMQDIGQDVTLRGNHGMTHSAYIVDPDGHGIEVLYELPREIWEHDIDAAQNYAEVLPTEGPEAMVDRVDYPVFGPVFGPAPAER